MSRPTRWMLVVAALGASLPGCMRQAPDGMESTIGPVAEFRDEVRRQKGEPPPELKVASSVIEPNGAIPQKYTCEGRNVSPPLTWSGLPKGTRSVLLLMEDPETPKGIFTHWIFYNIPPDVTSLEEGAEPGLSVGNVTSTIASGQGTNDFNNVGYSGPCPPENETHRYVFRVIALDRELLVDETARRSTILNAIRNHILSEGLLTGTYRRGGEEAGEESEAEHE